MPDLFVVAGPNGVGKTTLFKEIIPEGTEYINADWIAKAIRNQAGGLNTQDIANQEAVRLFYEKVKRQQNIAIETNLCDVETYKSFLGVKGLGYRLIIFFLYVDAVQICIERVKQRVSLGGHNVNPDVIVNRYGAALSLLLYYKNEIDQLILLDNSSGALTIQAKIELGNVSFIKPDSANWVHTIVSIETKKSESPESIDQARELYKKLKKE
jgi:predicted ABC-type ATPase